MRYGVIGDNLLERAVLASGMAPKAVMEGYAPAYSRAVVLATEHGVFDALAAGPRPADAVAAGCDLDPSATTQPPNLRVPLRALVVAERGECRGIAGLDTFSKGGRGIAVREGLSPEDWARYQRGMRAL